MGFHAGSERSSRAVHLHGELDAATAEDLRGVLAPLVRSDGDVEIDLNDLTFMDSSGLNVLLRAAADLGDRGKLRISGAAGNVLRLLGLSGVTDQDGIVVVAEEDGA
jgi:anti-sigma B factor antagonist